MISQPSVRHLDWDWPDAPVEALCHVERAFYPPSYAFPLHTHAYAEFFLIEQGEARHQLPQGEETLYPGDLLFIRPEQEHALAASPSSALGFANVAIAPSLFATLEQRFGQLPHWPWRAGIPPTAHRLLGAERQLLHEGLRRLEAPGANCDPLEIWGFCLPLLAAAARSASDRTPPWLVELRAALDAADAELLAGGVAALARRCGFSREHLNRQCRRHCDCTAQDLVGQARVAHAARLLRAGAEDILAVAAASGFANLSNFYRCFRRHSGCTPAAYRRRHRRVFV